MTTKPDDHLSTLALDVYFANGRATDTELESHLAGCARCQAYLSSLDALKESLPPAPPQPMPRVSRRWVLPSVASAGLLLAAGVVLFIRTRHDPLEYPLTTPSKTVAPPSPDYVGTKGTPAVQLLVHRQTATFIWDGQSAVRPGDAIALRVACEGFSHVAIAAREEVQWSRVTDAPCPSGSEPLPFTLVVDSAPGAENLAVVLSRSPIDDDTLRDAIGKTRRSDDVWALGFVLPKEP